MALRIWCNPKSFPAAVQKVAIAAAMAVLAERGVSLGEVEVAQAHIDQSIDFPEVYEGPPEGGVVYEWEDAWLAAIGAATAAARLDGEASIGSLLVLDERDGRFRGGGPGWLED
jgi:hypothetical protein